MAYRRERMIPKAWLPTIEHLRLVGQMSFAFTRRFLDTIDPAKLVSLEFDNLQDFGQLEDGVEYQVDNLLNHPLESEDSSGNPIIRRPGVMRGNLRLLQGRCTNLKNLSLRSVGSDHEWDSSWLAEKDEARYKEWGSFIDSVKANHSAARDRTRP
ncbi:hypothetical protein BDZ45DRAFT_740456 [Acephala macrosclerotiorum]|nr:hypothetical protein BDZ45DRAFT_740456 [Acephala macrosclerotiorum]